MAKLNAYQQKQSKRKKNNVGGAVAHGAIGVVPVLGSVPETYLGLRHAGAGKGASAGGAAAGIFVPGAGIIGGAYHGYNFQAGKNNARHGHAVTAGSNKAFYTRKVNNKVQRVKKGRR